MAFASAVTHKTVFGNKRVHFGTFTTSGATATGNVDTHLRICETMALVPHKSAVTAKECAVNESMPVAGSAVTIVHDAALDGYWMAIGY
jgi:hypothetical protein